MFSGRMSPKCLVNIKGLDRPVSITAAITRPLAPFVVMYINCLFCITLCKTVKIHNKTIRNHININ